MNIKYIESRHNALYREWVRSHRHAGRPGHPVWLEGAHLCESWLMARLPVQWLIVDENRLDHPDVRALWTQVDDEYKVVLKAGLFDRLSDVREHQGVLLIAQQVEHTLPPVLTETAVILDGIQDPGNVGTILRNCAATGVQYVLSTEGTAACWSPKVLRSGQGAHAGLQIIEGLDVRAWLLEQRTQVPRLPVLATTLSDATSLYGTSLPAACIWIFGSEGQGVSRELLALADQGVHIPHDQRYVESLNVGVASALCLFEQRRQTELK